jgi:hypothetical protein
MLGSLLALGGNLLGGLLNNRAADDRQEESQAFSAQQYATRWQTTAKDMQAAGYNPMLAYSQGVGNSPSGSPIGGNPYSSSMGSDTASAYHSMASAGQAEAQSRLIDETVKKTVAETNNVTESTKQIQSVVVNLEELRQNLIKEGYNLTAQGNVLRATASKLAAEIPALNAEALRNFSQADVNAAEAQLKAYDVSAAGTMGNVGRGAGQLKPIIDILMSVIHGFKR